MVVKFERNFFVPQIYETFTLCLEEGEVEFVIQDLPLEMFEKAADFMIKYYKEDETFSLALNVSEATLKEFYRFVLKEKTTVACLRANTREIVGLNVLSVKSKGVDTSFKTDDKTFKRMREAFGFINNFYDVHDHNNVIYFLYAHGLAVKTEYRGHRIASKLLKTRIPVMKAHDLSVTASLFTTAESQKAAFNLGYTEKFSISYATLQNKFKDFDFSSANCDDCKLLSLNI